MSTLNNPESYKQSPLLVQRLIDKVGQDLRGLIESTFYILDMESKLVPLIFNPTQNAYWPNITSRDIILKARKQGFTTIRLARLVAKCATQDYRRTIVVSHEEEATKRILGRAIELVKNCAVHMDAKMTETTITFPRTKSSLYIGTAGAKAFGRGDDITDYLTTEFAWYEKPDIITGIEEACVKDSEGCIESTAHGYGNPYHTLWLRARRQEQGMMLPDGSPRFYTPHFYGWWQDPTLEIECKGELELIDEYEMMLRRELELSDRKILWRRLKRDAMFDPDLFPQEYPAIEEEAFLASGAMVFDAAALARHEKEAAPLIWKGEIRDRGDRISLEPADRGRLQIWRTPKPNETFLVTADVAAGIQDGAWSVADVYDAGNNEQVAQWRGRTAPDIFGDMLCLLGAYYNYALLAPEVNNHGLTTCNQIKANEYPNLYHRDKMIGGTDMGWYTSPGRQGSRIELVNAAREAVREYQVKVNSHMTISECRTFVMLNQKDHDNSDMGPLDKCFSDTVITLGIAAVLLRKLEGRFEGVENQYRPRVMGRKRRGGRVLIPTRKTRYV